MCLRALRSCYGEDPMRFTINFIVGMCIGYNAKAVVRAWLA